MLLICFVKLLVLNNVFGAKRDVNDILELELFQQVGSLSAHSTLLILLLYSMDSPTMLSFLNMLIHRLKLMSWQWSSHVIHTINLMADYVRNASLSHFFIWYNNTMITQHTFQVRQPCFIQCMWRKVRTWCASCLKWTQWTQHSMQTPIQLQVCLSCQTV